MTEQENLFENKILSSIANAEFLQNDLKKLTGFMARKGNLYNNELMVIGRAVNGWISEADTRCANEFLDATTRIRFRIASQSIDNPNNCPMNWVVRDWFNENRNEYSTNRSAFWRVIKSLVFKLNFDGISDNNWSSHLVWSNLYKVSPGDEGNPSEKLCAVQLDGCKNLLACELDEYRPKRIVFLTGMNWADVFLSNFNMQTAQNNYKYVSDVGVNKNYKNMKAVIASHPQGKNETQWVSEVLQAFNQLEKGNL